MFFIVGLSCIVLLLSTTGVAGLRYWATHHKILDIPNGRSSHSNPTPRGGGLAIVATTLIFLLGYATVSHSLSLFSLLTYTAGALLIAAISWLDDLGSLPSRTRLITHTVGAILAIWVYGFWERIVFPLPFFEQFSLNWLGLPFTFLWIVGLTNAYNFMDGIDGLAGGQAVLTGLTWAIIGGLSNQPFLTALGLFIAASSLGFLFHNWPPARIFMGDVGSAFLGYTFALLPLMLKHLSPEDQGKSFLIGFLPLWPFIFDTTYTFLHRLRKGENVFMPHRSHLYQRLVIVGHSHRSVTLLYLGLALLGSFLAFAWFLQLKGSAIAITLGLPLICFCLWSYVMREERTCAIRKA